ncbi:hypothetical protein [Flammeovirga kamogawensis]|uniref:DUF4407 domain-containing protein n=1 Tax=Flammeovirga kamogawensis TaxID=373891 RepID=A0ABX8H447_9BACT|nr:hypothetical protein [Flammeovirga kamogawensis]MBB6463512.1 hypothetical protein [Flammeovirga kamogawensis]QWG10571.1 hypothetical protein KM029_24620 [Flammeovirga kamogawensis]TRX63677.1 hypothetical protein EO216_25005 [Flammeovirga kamogawensis]
MKPVKIIDYSLIVVSMLYSTYVTFLFFSVHTSLILASFISVFIVFLAHHYTYQLIEYFKKTGRINQYIILAVTLISIVFYAEWNGQLVHAKNISGIPTTEILDKQINTVQETINLSAKHTINGKTNWAKYQTFLDSQKQLKRLEGKRSDLLLVINTKTREAEITANSFRLFSLILFLLAFVATSINHSYTSTPDNFLDKVDEKRNKIISLIRDGEVNNVKMLVDYFNIPPDEAYVLFQKFNPDKSIGF